MKSPIISSHSGISLETTTWAPKLVAPFNSSYWGLLLCRPIRGYHYGLLLWAPISGFPLGAAITGSN